VHQRRAAGLSHPAQASQPASQSAAAVATAKPPPQPLVHTCSITSIPLGWLPHPPCSIAFVLHSLPFLLSRRPAATHLPLLAAYAPSPSLLLHASLRCPHSMLLPRYQTPLPQSLELSAEAAVAVTGVCSRPQSVNNNKLHILAGWRWRQRSAEIRGEAGHHPVQHHRHLLLPVLH
jgi:hypothetical protein